MAGSAASADLVGAAIAAFLRDQPKGRLAVGFSGGRDSSVLLHALAANPLARQRDLRAIHVDHGLHPDSPRWSEHARGFAQSLDLPIEIVRVDLSGRTEVGVEARARAARRELFAERMGPGDWILLAHHQDDQAETLLLRLLSGAGLPGLGAMRVVSDLHPGRIGRPLLELPGALIADYAAAQAIDALVDPANSDPQHERSWLRKEIIPRLTQRHPRLAMRLARTADWLQETADWLEAQALHERACRQGLDPTCLGIENWFALPQPLRFEVLAGWLAAISQQRPGAVAFAHIESDLIRARVDADPMLRWGDGQLRRYRRCIAWVAHRPALPTDWVVEWRLSEELTLPGGLGVLWARAIDASACDLTLRVGGRRGGERFRAAADGDRAQESEARTQGPGPMAQESEARAQGPGHRAQQAKERAQQQSGVAQDSGPAAQSIKRRPSRPLQHWLQELGVPPWQRQRLLLLQSQSDELLGVLDVDTGAVILRRAELRGWVFGIDSY